MTRAVFKNSKWFVGFTWMMFIWSPNRALAETKPASGVVSAKATSPDILRLFATSTDDGDVQSPNDTPNQPEQQSIRPLGEIRGPIPSGCHPQSIENYLLTIGADSKNFVEKVGAYFEHCEKYWTASENTGKMALLDFVNIDYDLSKNKNIQYTTLSMRDGSKVKAYIAIQDTVHKRPWVIAKCGVFCTASDSKSVLNYLIHLFDQSPFNVVFLSNRTGLDYIVNNEQLTLGGFSEAHDYYEIGHWLKNVSPFKDTIDSLHVLGMSLAGSAALYVEPLAEAYGYGENNRLFQSVMSFCPVVNLKPTMLDMYTNKKKRQLFSKLTWDELQQARPALHEVDTLLNRKDRPDFEEFPDLMGTIVSHYASRWAKKSETFRRTREIEKIDDLWNFNQFAALTSEIKTPLWVWSSKDDSIVNNDINAGSLANTWINENSRALGVLSVKFGNHCAYSTTYGFAVTSALLRSFVLSHSKDFLRHRELKILPFNPGINVFRFGIEKHLRQWWKAEANQEFVSLIFETHNNLQMPWCNTNDVFEKKFKDCRRKTKVKIPLHWLLQLNVQTPENSTEAEVLSRKLNSMLRLTAGGKTLEGTSRVPDQIEWYAY